MPPVTPRTLPRARKRASAKALAAFSFLVVSALCGLLVAGIAMPAIGAAWFTARSAQGSLNELPVAFDQPAQSQRTTVLDADGKVLAYFYDENRVYVGLDKIAPVMQKAILAIEDHRFYEHGPLDLQGTLRALVRNVAAGGVTQGGSTISQQYVKMVQVSEAKKAGDAAGVQAATDSSLGRKIRELRYAISVEKSLTKDQILERYLNIAYYGDGAYGIQVAAQHYFGVDAADLTLPQAAMLAGLVQSPTAYNPVQHKAAGLQRRNTVLNRMSELAVITPAQATAAKKAGFDEDEVTTTPNGCTVSDYPFVCDYIRRVLEQQTTSLGANVAERTSAVLRGGLTIKTPFEPKVQSEVQDRVKAVVGAKDPVIAAMDMIEPGTGRIVAMAQSRPQLGGDAKKGETAYNYSASLDMGGAQGFQAGSTFKAFTAAAALEKGIPLSKTYDAKQSMNFAGRTFESCSGRATVGNWPVRNSTGTNGVMDMNRAAQRSVNTYFAQLALEVGMCDVVKMAEKLGVESNNPNEPISSYDEIPSFTLGTAYVSPLSVAEAYATFASGGVHCDAVIVDSITAADGSTRAVPSANCKQVISSDVANTMNRLLSGVMTQGTGSRAATADRRPQAGKTGTIDNNAAVWFVGYTPQIAGAAMISVDIQRQPFLRGKSGYRYNGLKGYTVPSTGAYLEGSGSGDAGQDIWKPAMEEYLQGKEFKQFATAPYNLVYGERQWRWPWEQGGGPGQTGPGQTGPDQGNGPGQADPNQNGGPGQDGGPAGPGAGTR